MTWICVKSYSVYAAATEHVDQGLHTLFMRSDIPTGLYRWKSENKQTTRDLSILRNYAFNKEVSSLFTMFVLTQMTVWWGIGAAPM